MIARTPLRRAQIVGESTVVWTLHAKHLLHRVTQREFRLQIHQSPLQPTCQYLLHLTVLRKHRLHCLPWSLVSSHRSNRWSDQRWIEKQTKTRNETGSDLSLGERLTRLSKRLSRKRCCDTTPAARRVVVSLSCIALLKKCSVFFQNRGLMGSQGLKRTK